MNQYRNDSVPGYIYLMEALGYHGIFPGCYLKRCKIGLSRNPEARLDTFHANQPPCDIRIIKTIYVEDMSVVESELHSFFKNHRVKLHKSREWHDLDPLQLQRCIWLMSRHEAKRSRTSSLPVKALAGSLIALLGVGMLIGQSFQPQLTNQPHQLKGIRK